MHLRRLRHLRRAYFRKPNTQPLHRNQYAGIDTRRYLRHFKMKAASAGQPDRPMIARGVESRA